MKSIRFFLEFECFETIMTPLHCIILCDEMVFSLFSFFHNIEITQGSLLEKIGYNKIFQKVK